MLTSLGILVAGAGVMLIWSGITGTPIVPTLLDLVSSPPASGGGGNSTKVQ